MVMSNLTFIFWTLLLKRALAKTCCALGGTMFLLVKLLTLKSEIVSRRASKTLSKFESIPLITLSLKIWSCSIQDYALKATKVYEKTSAAEYKPNLPNLIGKEANFTKGPQRKDLHQPQCSQPLHVNPYETTLLLENKLSFKDISYGMKLQ